MKVTVEQRHIVKGRPGHPNYCPIALAVKDMFPGKEIGVGNNFFLSIGEEWYSIPRSARNFIDAFDFKLPVQPFSFTMKKRLT